jgi:adenosine deaminase
MTPDPSIDFSRIGAAQLPDLMRRMPKAELHLHIEGSLEPAMAFRLAGRHSVRLAYRSVADLQAAYDFNDLQSFLDLYYAGADVLRGPEDFEELAQAYFDRALADGVVHAEIFVDPQTHTMRGVPLVAMFEGLEAAAVKARAAGLSVSTIVCFLRHLSESEALQTLEECLPFRKHFIGVGLDSSERGHPPEKFAQVFARARSLGLHVVAHAGEEGPADYVRTALDVLQVERIDHGVRSIDDPALIGRLARDQVPLTVCPLSNLKLKVVKDLGQHPLKRLLDAGVRVTINADDPAYFGGYVLENYLQTQRALDLNARDLWQLAANSLNAAFVDEVQRARWLAQLNAVFRGFALQAGPA